MKKDKIWKGRIEKQSDPLAESFTKSINIDRELYSQDITATAAYAAGLLSIGVLSDAEMKTIHSGLKEIKENIESGKLVLTGYEDIHSLVEYELIKIAGKAAEKIHTGRSRNDQIVIDELLFVKELIIEVSGKLINLQKELLAIAEKNIKKFFPAYTHMQKAQPVLLSHYLLSYFDKFERNIKKLTALFYDIDYLPLGAAACAGSSYPIDQQLIAGLLKFGRIGKNSMDIAGNRDFIIDFIYCSAIIMINLSRFCEDLIIYNSREFSYIDIDESFCTGSSIMPQKKNPDVLEIIRGKSAVVAGHLMQIITLLKGLPSTYNSDLQEDKKILFGAKNETLKSIEIFTKIIGKIQFNENIINDSLGKDYTEATDAADYLVKKGESFRKAHNIIGRIVKYCIENNLDFKELTLKELKDYSTYFEQDFYDAINIESCVKAKKTKCGTSPEKVIEKISENKEALNRFDHEITAMIERIPDFDEIIAISYGTKK